MNLNIKGRVGSFQFGYNAEGKCEWYVINRDTGAIVDRAESMNAASKRAEYHDMMQKNGEPAYL